MDLVEELQGIAQKAAAWAVAAGAEAAEVVVGDGVELTTKVRLGEPELVQEAGSRALGLRVFRDRRPAVTQTTDLSDDALRRFVQETVDLAKLSEPDELNQLPPDGSFATAIPDLDLFDERVLAITAAQGLALAKEAEAASRGFSPRITNSEGATFSRSSGARAFAIEGRGRAGFLAGYRSSGLSLVVEPLADDAGGKKRNGYWWTWSRFCDGLEPAAEVGREAARRVVAKLGAEKIPTARMPVVFDPQAGRALLGALAGVISGGAIYRRASYLLDREGTAIASPLVNVADDPLVPRAPGSRPYDGDGLPTRRNVVVEGGVLRTFLLDTYSARKLGRSSNGCAGRGIGGGPHVTTSNFVLAPGAAKREQLFAGLSRALYVTDLMGFGFNATTGDFSRGAAGFLVENGAPGRPVSEVTISANFDALWKSVDMVADDLDARSATACPSFRVSEMMVAGR